MSDTKTVVIGSFESLCELAKGSFEAGTRIKLQPQLSTIKIVVEGNSYDAFIPGEQLRSLWELQEDFYRLAAYALHGVTDIRTLTQEERKQFELKVVTKKGSWQSEIITNDFWEAFFANTVGKMSGEEIGWTIIVCVFLGVGFLIWKSRDRRIALVEQEKTKQNHDDNIRKIVESFNQCNVSNKDFVQGCVRQVGASIDNLAETIARRSQNANRISVAGKQLNAEEIDQIKKREKGKPDNSIAVTGIFSILSLDKSDSVWNMKLRNDTDGEEMMAKLAPDAIDDDDGNAAKEIINDAFYKNIRVEIDISRGKKRNLINSVSHVIE